MNVLANLCEEELLLQQFLQNTISDRALVDFQKREANVLHNDDVLRASIKAVAVDSAVSFAKFISHQKYQKLRKRAKYTKQVKRRAKKDPWTLEEDKLLLEAVPMFTDADDEIDWGKIDEYVGTKSYSKCFQHWKRVLNPTINKGPWKEEEDKLLHELKSLGQGWSFIGKQISRTDLQCRIRYYKNLAVKK